MTSELKVVRRVEFSDTDMAGIVHYSNFFRYMETAEHAFFRSLGFSVVTRQTDPPVGWPRVHADCDYFQPLRFEDEIEIHLLVTEKRSKSLSYQFRFRRLTPGPVLEVARGNMTVVCVKHEGGSMRSTTIPKQIADQIEAVSAYFLREPRVRKTVL